MNFWNKVIAILWKDILSEMRAREIVITVLVFTLLIIMIFNFAFGANQQMIQSVAPGMLWVTFAFAGVLSLNRSFVSEKQEGCIEGLMGCPVNREVIYAGKMLGSLVFMLIIEGEVEFLFQNGRRTTAKAGECFCLAEASEAPMHFQDAYDCSRSSL